jgi:hypothetical protein
MGWFRTVRVKSATSHELFNGDQVLACEGTGVLPCVPKTDASGRVRLGLLVRGDFMYDAVTDHYTCPAGAHLTNAALPSSISSL